MSYFKQIKNFDDLKKQYRTLAKENHPDRGGDEKVMVAINNEFDTLFPIWKRFSNADGNESAAKVRSEFYTENGWKGSRYENGLGTKEIARRVRVYLKQVYPLYKFSVTFESFAGGSSIGCKLMEAPHELFNISKIKEILDKGFTESRDYQNAKFYADQIERDEIEFDIYNIDNLGGRKFFNETAYKVLKDMIDQVDSYRWNDSDARIDYFNTNFYVRCGVGKYGKPFKIVPKEMKKNKKGLSKVGAA